MDTMYSEAFDHLQTRQVFELDRKADAEENIKHALKKRSDGSRSAAFKKKSQIGSSNSFTQDESVGEYIDSSEINPRIPSSLQGSTNDVAMRGHSQFRQGHTAAFYMQNKIGEDTLDYQYATEDVHIPPEQRKGPFTQRSVSLKDDYSQPADRLSKSSGRRCSESQDYVEPYQSQGVGSITQVVAPDTSGIYELAKDITPPPTQVTFPNRFEGHDSHSKHYSHVVSSTTNKLQNTRIDEESENYDHLNTWGPKTPPLQANLRTSGNHMKKSGGALRQGSATPEDFFPVRGGGLPQSMYQDLPSEYQEPWDSQDGQKKLSRLMQRAESSDDRRQSIDKNSPSRVKQLQHPDRAGQSSANVLSQGSQEDNPNLYELAWDPNSNVTSVHNKNKPCANGNPSVPPHGNRKVMPNNYEDAWDTGDKQREFEEKLENIRKQRLSEGKIITQDDASVDVEPSTEIAARGKEELPTSPVSRYFEREQVSRSDSCRSLAALAEKVDPTIPLEDQCFYHGNIKRSEAERMLCVFKDGSYLIRRSESNRKDFSLTLKGWNGIPMHMKITAKPNGTYILGENSPPFHTIPEMVEYYTRKELPVQDAARICLLYPIPS